MPSLTLYCTITAENGKRVPITVSDSATPTDLRLQVSSATKIPLGTLRLIFRGRMIKDDSSLNVFQEYKVEQDCVLHCMGKPNKDASSSSETPAPLPAAAAPTITAAALPSSNAAPPTDPLQQALEMLRTNASSPAVYQTAVTTLDKILTNIMQNPREEKFRKVKVHNGM
jgi:ubiquilin